MPILVEKMVDINKLRATRELTHVIKLPGRHLIHHTNRNNH